LAVRVLSMVRRNAILFFRIEINSTTFYELTPLAVPWVVWGFFKLITPFIDPLTREKLKFNEDIRIYVPPEQLWKEFNGDLDFEYDHTAYWPAFISLCNQRRAEYKARWEKAGKHYGESERYLKGDDSALDIQAPSKPPQGAERIPTP
jgi:CRAL/TRIO domain